MSDSFETPKPGFPGSPSHVVAKNLTSNSAVVCWRESAIGTPFTLYNVEIIESQATGRANLKVLRLNRSSVGAVPGCSMGVKVCVLSTNVVFSCEDPLPTLSIFCIIGVRPQIWNLL